jgi:hypothetical protein
MRRSSVVGHQIGWALDAGRAAVENVGVDLSRADVTVSQKLLDGPDVVASARPRISAALGAERRA